MTPAEMDNAVAHVERWAELWACEGRTYIRPEGGRVVVTMRRGRHEAEVAIETDDGPAIHAGLRYHLARLNRRVGKRGVKVLGAAGYGTWRERGVA